MFRAVPFAGASVCVAVMLEADRSLVVLSIIQCRGTPCVGIFWLDCVGGRRGLYSSLML